MLRKICIILTHIHNIVVEIHCGSVATPSHGNVIGNNDVVDSVLMISCDYGFRLSGSAHRSCMENGVWNGNDAI